MPCAELISGVAVNPHDLKTARLVQPDASGVGQSGARIGSEIALRGQDSKERRIQAASDSAALEIWVNIHRRFHGPLIRSARLVPPGIRIACDAAAIFAHQPWIRGKRLADA